jgi:hypothetical protein
MSKITPKNLSYDSTLPPFLARLQSQNTSRDGRQEFSVARPKKARDLDAEKEDEPVVFDETTGETLSKDEWEDREKFEGTAQSGKSSQGDEKKDDGGHEDGEAEPAKKEEKVAGIGASRKRKAGKVVGGDVDDEDASESVKALKDAVQKAETSLGKAKDEGVKKTEKTTGGKGGSKKGKKIKLSFGDDD